MVSIRFLCLSCGKSLSAPANLAGKRPRCACGSTVVVPALPPPVTTATFEFESPATKRPAAFLGHLTNAVS